MNMVSDIPQLTLLVSHTHRHIKEDALVGLKLAAALDGSIDALLCALACKLLVGLYIVK